MARRIARSSLHNKKFKFDLHGLSALSKLGMSPNLVPGRMILQRALGGAGYRLALVSRRRKVSLAAWVLRRFSNAA